MPTLKTWAMLKATDADGECQEIEVEVEIYKFTPGARATRYDPPEDPYLDFNIFDADGNCVDELITVESYDRIIEECFEYMTGE